MENISLKSLDVVIHPLKYATSVIRKRIEETQKKGNDDKITLPKSWIRTVRQALNMPVSVIAKKLGVSPQAIIEFEKSEAHIDGGKISIKNLSKVADAMGMQLVYGFVPKSHPSLELMVHSVSWYKTQQNLREKKESVGVSFHKRPYEYNKRKKKLAEKKATTLPKSLWK